MATTADYLNKLVTQKNALADNLVTKGVTATHDETLETLVPKVLDISSGSGGSGGIDGDLSYGNIALGFIANALYISGNNGQCGYYLSNLNNDRLCIFRNFSSYNLTHSYAIDFTNIKKIIIHGSTKSNYATLTATAYYKIASETTTTMDDDWTVLNQSKGADLSDFSMEIDCSSITGENYIHLGVMHGTETNSYTSYLYIDSVEFIG